MTVTHVARPWASRVICKDPPGTPAWLDAHTGCLGGHDVAAILGMGHKTPLALWAELTGKVEREDISRRPWIRRGNALEPVVAQLYAEENPHMTLMPSPGLVRDAKLPYLVGTVDRLVEDGRNPGDFGILECKTFGFWKRAEWDAGVPDAYLVQVQLYMRVMGLEWSDVSALPIDNQKDEDSAVLTTRVPIDPVFQEYMDTRVQTFWCEHVLKDIPPQALQDDAGTLRRMYPREESGKSVELPIELVDAWYRKKEMLAARKELDGSIGDIDSEIALFMGPAELGLLGNGKAIRWRVEPRKEHIVKASEPRVMREVNA